MFLRRTVHLTTSRCLYVVCRDTHVRKYYYIATSLTFLLTPRLVLAAWYEESIPIQKYDATALSVSHAGMTGAVSHNTLAVHALVHVHNERERGVLSQV
jgi:hypothetical protein